MQVFLATAEEHDRAVKRQKVDSPTSSPSHTEESSIASDSEEALTNGMSRTPSRIDRRDAVGDTSGEGSPASAAQLRGSRPDHDQERGKHGGECRVALSASESGCAWRGPGRPSSCSTVSVVSVSSAPLPVSTVGSITTLHSLSQLQILVSSTNTTSAREKTHPDLRLKLGETVMLLLHFDEASLRSLISAATSELSQMRVYTLNLAKLPPQDYEPTPENNGSASSVLPSSSHKASSATGSGADTTARHSASLGAAGELRRPVAPTVSAISLEASQNAMDGVNTEEDEEEEVLVPAVHPMAVATAAAEFGASAEHGRSPNNAAAGSGALAFDETASASSISSDLHHASAMISDKLRHMLAADTILHPHASQQRPLSGNSKREPLLFPAMVVWRAAGAPREEYPPSPPQTYSSQPCPTPAELFCDRMSMSGGPLVVKEATSIDQVHSLTLFRPVYTMEHLFRTLVRAVAPSFSSKAPGDKSRTVLYLGASWCPPCMRFVHEMPHFMRNNLPTSVVCTLKADMDLAKPIYDYLKVETIPTFVVLDNEVLMQCYDELQQRGVGNAVEGHSSTLPSEYLRTVQKAFSRAELGRLQNSNRQLVRAFVCKHCQSLSFDDDF